MGRSARMKQIKSVDLVAKVVERRFLRVDFWMLLSRFRSWFEHLAVEVKILLVVYSHLHLCPITISAKFRLVKLCLYLKRIAVSFKMCKLTIKLRSSWLELYRDLLLVSIIMDDWVSYWFRAVVTDSCSSESICASIVFVILLLFSSLLWFLL